MKTGIIRWIWTGAVAFELAAWAAAAGDAPPAAPVTSASVFNVLAYGAKGDGVTLDTAAINQAIEACARAGGGQVYFPPGRYLSGTVHLASHLTLWLTGGATLLGTTNLDLYEAPAVPAFMPEARWGKWHRALIVGNGLEDVTLAGGGRIDGQRVFDPNGEEHQRGPHLIAFSDCRRFLLRDLELVDAANYAIFFQVSDDVAVRGLKIVGGWDGVHFRGAPERWCRNVDIIGCELYTGDDAIAGRYWENVVIRDCVLNSSCNGVRLIGPAVHLVVDQCLFYGPGRQPHRSSNRRNMLGGILLQPGGWDRCDGVVDDVLLANNTMKSVAAPLAVWSKPGNPVGRVTVSGLEATGCYRAALSVESWGSAVITNVVLRHVSAEFDGGVTAPEIGRPVRGPGVDVRPLPAWGLYAHQVDQLTVEDCRFSLARDDLRPAVFADGVRRLTLDGFRFTPVAGVANPLVTTNVESLIQRDAPRVP